MAAMCAFRAQRWLSHGLAGCLFLSALLCSCRDDGKATAGLAPQAAAPVETLFPQKLGQIPFRAQITLTTSEQQRGLMYRETMGADEGMLFLYTEPRPLRFWMRHTRMPLDLALFDRAGRLREIYRLFPNDEEGVSSRGQDLQYALEMNSGWLAAHGLRPGLSLDLQLLAAAVAARGRDPADYGLPPASGTTRSE